MQKKIWLSALDSSKETVQSVMGKLQGYGLAVDGHFFEDNLEKMAWIAARQQLLDTSINLWVLIASAESLAKPSQRYGLAVLALAVQAQRGAGFPVVILQTEGDTILPETLPTPLSGAAILPLAGDGYAAKLVATVHKPEQAKSSPYRIDVYGIQNIGQWFEVGPQAADWQGAIFGVSNGEILVHAVGSAGQLPEKSVLNYPQQGFKVALGDLEFTAWGVQNIITAEDSYYLKVQGEPEKIMFCPYSSGQETEAYIISLQ